MQFRSVQLPWDLIGILSKAASKLAAKVTAVHIYGKTFAFYVPAFFVLLFITMIY